MRELHHERTHHRQTGGVGLPEGSVDVRKVGITVNDSLAEMLEGFVCEGPGLSTLGVNVSMSTEEGHPGTELIPTDSQFL